MNNHEDSDQTKSCTDKVLSMLCAKRSEQNRRDSSHSHHTHAEYDPNNGKINDRRAGSLAKGSAKGGTIHPLTSGPCKVGLSMDDRLAWSKRLNGTFGVFVALGSNVCPFF